MNFVLFIRNRQNTIELNMKSKGVLSSSFNMSLGFIPVIIAILLSEFITQDVLVQLLALYTLFTT